MRSGFYDEKMTQLLMREIEMISDIELAIENNQFKMVYQPQINLIDNSLMGVESLIRWNHPDKGNISPLEFIPVAEKRGLIVDIGLYGLHEVCKQARIWQEQGFDFKKIALNISALHIKEKDFTEQIKTALDKFQISPNRLELELTESIFAEDVDYIKNVMKDLRKIGVTFAIDDFGTGYSSLAYLKNLEVTPLKIDQTFVRDMLIDSSDAEIIKATIDMAKALQLITIAEGIEEEEQAEFLTKLGCEIGQGYYFSRPLDVEELVRTFS